MIEPAISRMIMDINSPEARCSLTVIRGDTARQLRISLTCDGKPYDIGADCYVLLTGVKPDGVEIIETCSVIENQVVYDFTEKAINVEGITECQILICENQSKQQIAAAKFSLIVLPAVIDDSSASKSEAYTSLVRLLSNTEQLIKSVEKRLKNGEFNGQGIWATTNKFQDGMEHFFVRKESVVRITNSAKAIQVNDILLFPEGNVGVVKSITTGFFEISPSGISLRGTYFFTDEDREKIKADSIAFLTEELAKRGQIKPEFANSIEECTDETKLYILPDGYIYAYIMTEITEGGYTNLLPTAVSGEDGSIYNGIGYKDGVRLSSSGEESPLSEAFLTGYIPVKVGETLYLNGNYIKTDWTNAGSANARFYNSHFENIDSSSTPMGGFVSGAAFIDVVTNDEGYVTQFTMNPNWTYYSNWGDLAYIRMTLIGTGEGCVIAHEPIIEPTIKTENVLASTGHAFVPADYESRIVALEYMHGELEGQISKNTENINALNDRFENLESLEENSTSIPDVWQEAIQEAAEKIKAKHNIGGVNCASVIWTTDIHAKTSLDEKGKRLGNVAKAIMDEADVPLFISTGDLMSQSSYTDTTNIYTELGLVRKWLEPIPYNQQALIMGNHDGAWGNTTATEDVYYNQLPIEEIYNLIYRKQAMDMKRVSGDNGTYYYLDNIPQKVRYIFLNTNNVPYLDENKDGVADAKEDGKAIYDRFHSSCLCQEQINWLVNTALDMPEGYTALLFGHEPYPGDWNMLVTIVDSFNNRVQCTNSFTDEGNTWRNSTVNKDFTGAKGTIAAVFAGHVHYDYIRDASIGNAMYTTCPIVMMTTSLGGNTDRTLPEGATQPTRGEGDATEFVMDIITVNTRDKKIYLTRLGAGEDREIEY